MNPAMAQRLSDRAVERARMLTDGCPRCHHPAAEHYNNHCHHLRDCDCWYSGPEDWKAGDDWNAFMGRPVPILDADAP